MLFKMKTIVLIRHSEPIKDRTLPTALLPLSERGILRAQELFSLDIFRSVNAVYSSPYQRAFSTAEKLCVCFSTVIGLRERDSAIRKHWMRIFGNISTKITTTKTPTVNHLTIRVKGWPLPSAKFFPQCGTAKSAARCYSCCGHLCISFERMFNRSCECIRKNTENCA